jgi:hypothetical protein
MLMFEPMCGFFVVFSMCSLLVMQDEIPIRKLDLLVHDGGNEIIAVYPGGCLRGPLEVKGRDGRQLLKLEAGIDLPSGCSMNRQ